MVAPASMAISSLPGSLLAAALSTWQNVRVRPRPGFGLRPRVILRNLHNPKDPSSRQFSHAQEGI